AESLAGDRARAQYSADALKGGTEPAAAPPSAEQGAAEDIAANSANSPPPPPAQTAPDALPPQSSAPGTLPTDTGVPPPAPAAVPPPAPAPQVASADMPPPAVPSSPAAAVPAVPAIAANQVSPSDAALGFRSSAAPPLDASVAQFVPASILARYRQTAAIGPEPAVPAYASGADDGVMASNLVMPTRRSRVRRHHVAMGGPEKMTGAVVANFDALQPTGAAPSANPVSGGPAATVYFPKETTVLTREARSQVDSAAKAFMAQGGQGYVRVIGHAADGLGKLSAERHLVLSFERSQARANAVARALISAGVPADRVLVQTVSDQQSAYAAQSDDGRRAEIFFQS
ncbi:MAG TPA: OmpA family protein, partial [Rhizomicrobium sp.]|nr:OmpA family protein [Rhizomicrobium sp.]